MKSKSYAYGGQSGYGGYYNQGYRGAPAGTPYNPLAGKSDDKRTARKKKTRISHLVKRTMERNPEPELELVGMDRMLAKNRCMAGKTKMTTTLMHT